MTPSESFGIPSYQSVAADFSAIYAQYFGRDNLAAILNPLTIEGRWEPSEGVSCTRYSDGTEVLVNRSEFAWRDLPPHSYRINSPAAARRESSEPALA